MSGLIRVIFDKRRHAQSDRTPDGKKIDGLRKRDGLPDAWTRGAVRYTDVPGPVSVDHSNTNRTWQTGSVAVAAANQHDVDFQVSYLLDMNFKKLPDGFKRPNLEYGTEFLTELMKLNPTLVPFVQEYMGKYMRQTLSNHREGTRIAISHGVNVETTTAMLLGDDNIAKYFAKPFDGFRLEVDIDPTKKALDAIDQITMLYKGEKTNVPLERLAA